MTAALQSAENVVMKGTSISNAKFFCGPLFRISLSVLFPDFPSIEETRLGVMGDLITFPGPLSKS